MRINNGATDPTDPPTWQPDEWVCSHYQRKDFGPNDLDVYEHLGHCYEGYDSDPTDPPTVATDPSTVSRNQLVNEHNQHPADEWLIELCETYLSTLHSGAWGRTFYVHDKAGRRAAAEFLAKTIEGVNNARQQRSARG